MPTRLFLAFICFLLLALLSTVLTCCRDFKKLGPLKSGPRKGCIKLVFKFFSSLLLIIFGFRTTITKKEIDYAEYLGPDYKAEHKEAKTTSTIVCNHVSWVDGLVLIKTILPAFAPKEELSGIPLVSHMLNALDSIYMPRGGTPEGRTKAIECIRNR